MLLSLKNSHVPKIIFHGYFGKYCLCFFKKILISNKKGYTDFCHQTSPSFQTSYVQPQFFTVFSENIWYVSRGKKGYINFLCKTPPFPKK